MKNIYIITLRDLMDEKRLLNYWIIIIIIIITNKNKKLRFVSLTMTTYLQNFSQIGPVTH